MSRGSLICLLKKASSASQIHFRCFLSLTKKKKRVSVSFDQNLTDLSSTEALVAYKAKDREDNLKFTQFNFPHKKQSISIKGKPGLSPL